MSKLQCKSGISRLDLASHFAISRFVNRFIDRYIPGYHFLVPGVTSGGFDQQTGSRLIPPWMQDEPTPPIFKNPPARCLRLTIDEDRRLRKIEYCRRQ
jgi:hypothetical protein